MTTYQINMPDDGWITIFRENGDVEEHATDVNVNMPRELLNAAMEVNAQYLVKFIAAQNLLLKYIPGSTCYSLTGECPDEVCACGVK